MSRIQTIALILGIALIAVGLFADGTGAPVDARMGATRESVGTGPGGVTPDGVPIVIARLTHADDGSPAAGARVALWRMARGEGAAFRRAQRVARDRNADASGVARFEAPLGEDLELVARAKGGGPTRRVPIGRAAPGRVLEIDVEITRRPAPLRLIVRGVAGEALAGVTIHGVPHGARGTGDFPGGGEALRRTTGDGIADLDGSARSNAWIVIDAAGYAPSALSAADVEARARSTNEEDRTEEIDVVLERAAAIRVAVADADGVPLNNVQVVVEFVLDGWSTRRSVETNRHGVAIARGLPPRTRLDVTVLAANEGAVLHRETVELDPGTTGDVSVGPLDGER